MARQKRKKLPQELVTAEIESLNHEARGVTHVDGKVVFVDGALPEESVKFKYTWTKSQYDEGQCEEVLSASEHRVSPKCEVFGICGGCSLQHIDPVYQISHKDAVLKEQIFNAAKVRPTTWLAPLTANEWGYRRKGRLGVKNVPKKGEVLVGFREKNGRYITQMNRCEILHPRVGHKLPELKAWLAKLEAKETIPQIELAVAEDYTALIIRHLVPLSEHDLGLIKEFAQKESYWVYLQPKGPDTITKFWPESGGDMIQYSLPTYDLTMKFHPKDFTQINFEINQKMLKQALDLLDIQSEDRVLDLFCGLGNFSLPLARTAKHVVGVEGDMEMVERAYANAKANQLDNADFYAANLFDPADQEKWFHKDYDKILLDPPRAGAQEIIRQLNQFSAKRIVYVSCNPATLARDTHILVNEMGFKLEAAGVMDMFPHTKHVESMALFTR